MGQDPVGDHGSGPLKRDREGARSLELECLDDNSQGIGCYHHTSGEV